MLEPAISVSHHLSGHALTAASGPLVARRMYETNPDRVVPHRAQQR